MKSILTVTGLMLIWMAAITHVIAADLAGVVVRGKVVFQIAGAGPISAAGRAKVVNERIQKLITSGKEIPPIKPKQTDHEWLINAGDQPLLTVTPDDVTALEANAEKLASYWAELLNDALTPTKEQVKVKVKVDGIEFFELVNTERSLASERADFVKSHIREAIKRRTTDTVKVEVRNRRYVLTKGSEVLAGVSHEDAVSNHTTVPELADLWAKALQEGLNRAIRERSRDYLLEAALKSLAALALLTLSLWLLFRLRQLVRAKIDKIQQKRREMEKVEFGGLVALRILISWLHWGLALGFVGLCAYYVMLQFPYTRDYLDLSSRVFVEASDQIKKIFLTKLFGLGETPVSLKTILLIAFFITLVIWLARRTRRFLEEKLLVQTRMDRGQAQAFSTVVSYLIILFGFVIGLRFAGLDLSALTVIAGAVGIGIGFGLQNIANNFISGLIILFERPIQVGDRVELGSILGDVVKISARSTTILTNDNIAVIVPNSNFISSTVINWTHLGDRRVRFAVKINVDNNSDVRQVEKVLLEVAAECPDLLRTPAPTVRFIGFGENGLNFELRVWTIKRISKPGELRSDLYFAIFEKFKQYNITVPYPQRDLHLRSPLPIEARVVEQVILEDKVREPEEILKDHPK